MNIIEQRKRTHFDHVLFDIAEKARDEIINTIEKSKRPMLKKIGIFAGYPGRCRLLSDVRVGDDNGGFGLCGNCHYGEECKRELQTSHVVLGWEDFDDKNPRRVASLWLVLASRECAGIKRMFGREGSIAGVLFEPLKDLGGNGCLVSYYDGLPLHRIIAKGLSKMIDEMGRGCSPKQCALSARQAIRDEFDNEMLRVGEDDLTKGMLYAWASSFV